MSAAHRQQRSATEPEEATDSAGKGVALARAAQVLGFFRSATRALGLAELAQRSSVPKATLLGILNTLVAHDLLVEEPESGRYRLGYGWLRLADIRRNQTHIRESALPVMRQMRDAVDETVILSLRVGDRRVHLDYVESTQPVRRIAHPGHEAPLHVGAAGLVLLAGLSEADLAAYLLRAPIEPASRADILASLERIRREGYAIVAGTVNPDTAAVSAPIKGYDGESVASLTISCPRDRFTDKLAHSCAEQVLEGARALSRALGHAG